MNLNTLKLPLSLVADLYPKSLVITEADGDSLPLPLADIVQPAIERAPLEPPSIAFLGENKQGILVLVRYAHSPFLPAEELAFLSNMLTACKLELADVAIINLANRADTSYKEILQSLKGTVFLLFGTDPATLNLPISFPQFQVQTFSGYTFLSTPPLDQIREDKMLKSKLWVCLRRIFNV